MRRAVPGAAERLLGILRSRAERRNGARRPPKAPPAAIRFFPIKDPFGDGLSDRVHRRREIRRVSYGSVLSDSSGPGQPLFSELI